MGKNNLRLAIICGGTGGHFFPGLTIARAVCAAGGEARLFIETGRQGNQKELAAKAGVLAVDTVSAPLPRGPAKVIPFAIQFCRGYFGARTFLSEFKPDAVLGMGSFTSAPMCFAAISLKIPVFLHDGNARVGKANRFFSRWARQVMTAFPAVNGTKLRCPYRCVGMPLRPELLAGKTGKEEAIASLNAAYAQDFSAERPFILVFGGSQGAATINRVIPEALGSLRRSELQVAHLAGKGNVAETSKIYSAAGVKHLALESSDQMAAFYSAADLVFCRSGGGTVSELAYFGKYAVLVPFPFAAEKHQDDNAVFYAASGAAEVVQNDVCDKATIVRLATAALADSGRLAALAGRGAALAAPRATDDILETIAASVAAPTNGDA